MEQQDVLFSDYCPGVSSRVAPILSTPQPQRNRNYLECPFCPCIFFTLHDQQLHMQKFTARQDRHIILWHDELERRKQENDLR